MAKIRLGTVAEQNDKLKGTHCEATAGGGEQLHASAHPGRGPRYSARACSLHGGARLLSPQRQGAVGAEHLDV